MSGISITWYRYFVSTSNAYKNITPNNIKNKRLSSQIWLKRQLSDPYVEKAKMMNYRCRSAFKLIEINEKFKLLKPGQTVIDCGAAPGSWTQVAVEKVKSKKKETAGKLGKVISIDKQPIHPIEGAIILGNVDFSDLNTQSSIQMELNGGLVQVVLSDMAPSASGIKDMDNENMLTLCYSALRFAVQVTGPGGILLMKLWQCGAAKQLENDLSRFYTNVKFIKPNSSRSDSAEIFILGREFKGLQTS